MDYMYSDDYYYNNTYQMKFEENHAKKSGEHFFVAGLMGFCTASYYDDTASHCVILAKL